MKNAIMYQEVRGNEMYYQTAWIWHPPKITAETKAIVVERMQEDNE